MLHDNFEAGMTPLDRAEIAMGLDIRSASSQEMLLRSCQEIRLDFHKLHHPAYVQRNFISHLGEQLVCLLEELPSVKLDQLASSLATAAFELFADICRPTVDVLYFPDFPRSILIRMNLDKLITLLVCQLRGCVGGMRTLCEAGMKLLSALALSLNLTSINDPSFGNRRAFTVDYHVPLLTQLLDEKDSKSFFYPPLFYKQIHAMAREPVVSRKDSKPTGRSKEAAFNYRRSTVNFRQMEHELFRECAQRSVTDDLIQAGTCWTNPCRKDVSYPDDSNNAMRLNVGLSFIRSSVLVIRRLTSSNSESATIATMAKREKLSLVTGPLRIGDSVTIYVQSNGGAILSKMPLRGMIIEEDDDEYTILCLDTMWIAKRTRAEIYSSCESLSHLSPCVMLFKLAGVCIPPWSSSVCRDYFNVLSHLWRNGHIQIGAEFVRSHSLESTLRLVYTCPMEDVTVSALTFLSHLTSDRPVRASLRRSSTIKLVSICHELACIFEKKGWEKALKLVMVMVKHILKDKTSDQKEFMKYVEFYAQLTVGGLLENPESDRPGHGAELLCLLRTYLGSRFSIETHAASYVCVDEEDEEDTEYSVIKLGAKKSSPTSSNGSDKVQTGHFKPMHHVLLGSLDVETVQRNRPRFYVKGQSLSVSNDDLHELSGAGSSAMYKEDIAKHMLAFYNSGLGGRLLYGINPRSSKVTGLVISGGENQGSKDNLRLAVDDLLTKVTPPIPALAVELHFTPVCEQEGYQSADTRVRIPRTYVFEILVHPRDQNEIGKHTISSGKFPSAHYVRYEGESKRRSLPVFKQIFEQRKQAQEYAQMHCQGGPLKLK